MVRPIFNVINTRNLINNFLLIRKLSLNKKLWIVIKSNAYGHGIVNIYNILYKYSIDGFAVLSIEEAIYLRNLGYKNSILLLEGCFDLEELKLCFKWNFIIVIHSYWQINLFKKINYDNKIDIYLKFNDDLNRLGFDLNKIENIVNIIKSFKNINNISIIIHFAKFGNKYYLKKKTYFNKKLVNFKFKNISLFSSSSLIYSINDIKSNWIRIGILLYGVSPTGNFNDISKYGFKPVMNFISKIICIRRIKKGQSIGYNHSFFSSINRFIGVVACGYADGYPRQLSNIYYVLINNVFKANILGYISMDMMVVDLFDNFYNIKIGDVVELWGENLHIDDVAKFSNTINYNLMCSINSNRVKFMLK